MQKFNIVFVVTDEQIGAIAHAVVSDPLQAEGETAADAWVRRVMSHEGMTIPARMAAIAAKADKYLPDYLEEKAAEGDAYLCATAKARMSADDASEKEKAEFAAYCERKAARLESAKLAASRDPGDDVSS